jgi:hypothetical protein
MPTEVDRSNWLLPVPAQADVEEIRVLFDGHGCKEHSLKKRPSPQATTIIGRLMHRRLTPAFKLPMVLCTDRRALIRIKAWALADSPAKQNAVKFESRVIAQSRRVMFLDGIRKASTPRLGAISEREFSVLPPARF